MEITKIVANNIKNIRKSLGYSQSEISDVLSIDVSVYNRIENGKILPSHDKLYSFSKFFRVPIEKFFEGLGSNIQQNYDNSQYNSNVQINFNNNEIINEIKDVKKELEKIYTLIKNNKNK